MFRSTILFATLVASAPCLAEPVDTDVKREKVPYGDLNLASDAGQTKLDRRIRAAANRVCSDSGYTAMENFQRGRKCRSIAIADARHQVRTVTVELAVREPVRKH